MQEDDYISFRLLKEIRFQLLNDIITTQLNN